MRKEDDNLEKCIITGMVEGSRGRGTPRRAWCDDIKDWTHLSTDELMQSTKDRAGSVVLITFLRVMHYNYNYLGLYK